MSLVWILVGGYFGVSLLCFLFIYAACVIAGRPQPRFLPTVKARRTYAALRSQMRTSSLPSILTLRAH